MINRPAARTDDEGALQVRVDDGVEVLVVHAEEQAVFGDAGVVDQRHRCGRAYRRRFSTAALSALLSAMITRPADSAEPPADLICVDDRIELVGVARNGDDVKSVLGEALDDGCADASRSAGDDGDSFFVIVCSLSREAWSLKRPRRVLRDLRAHLPSPMTRSEGDG